MKGEQNKKEKNKKIKNERREKLVIQSMEMLPLILIVSACGLALFIILILSIRNNYKLEKEYKRMTKQLREEYEELIHYNKIVKDLEFERGSSYYREMTFEDKNGNLKKVYLKDGRVTKIV